MTPGADRAVEPASKTRLRLWLKLLKVTSQTEAALRRRLRDDHGTTLPRFDVMAALARYPKGIKMSELSSYLRVSNGNVTGIVDRLTKEGLALRVAVEGDRRSQLARLTPMGAVAFKDLATRHEAWIDGQLGGLSEEEAETVLAILSRVGDAGDDQ
ncbi:MAG: MarR family transcriptional regulator [Boseongicola sp. SB0673_bin_14]|nr:MarR family transcriptional regulator [Boseongicola sp. SB0665_bin_10]MYA36060.1 MarR family transcriptional regulator [Gammaproteobacteria bacterium]MYF50018.1 MarR family transcriptional regulator [Gammaproteobacteria bacterium]MYI68754.1 MarR family transcriptional regulator [Boseongicola sp. SB0673_bin_14]